MAEYLIQGETLTNLESNIRVLNGIEDTLTPSQMTSNVQSANEEVDTQSALIDAIIAALDEKFSSSGGAVTMITFTIDGTEYQADEGMTWEQWCDSDYNIDGFHIENDYEVWYGDSPLNSYIVINAEGYNVDGTIDVIVNGAMYELQSSIGGGGGE